MSGFYALIGWTGVDWEYRRIDGFELDYGRHSELSGTGIKLGLM